MRDFLLKISEICLKDSMIHTGGCGVDGVGGGGGGVVVVGGVGGGGGGGGGVVVVDVVFVVFVVPNFDVVV